jgi:hypothetical protein
MLKALPRLFLYIHEFFPKIKIVVFTFAKKCYLDRITALFLLFHQVFARWALPRPFLYIHEFFQNKKIIALSLAS